MTNNSLLNLSHQQLRRAAEIKERIEGLQKELGRLLGAPATMPTAAVAASKKHTMSAAARARIAAAQKARWAKQKRPAASKPAAKSKPKFSPEVRARIAAALKARWAKAKAAGKKTL